MILFAIYKNGFHKVNERAKSEEEAITKYIIASDLEEFAYEMDFVSQYSFQLAIAGVQYYGKSKSNSYLI